MGVVVLMTVIPGAPMRRPEGQVGGNLPLIDSLLFIITLFFLFSGIAFGAAVGTVKGSGDVIKFATKTFAGLGGMVLMFLMISQFIAYFNYTNLPTVIAVNLAGILQNLAIGPLPLLILMTIVIVLLDFIMPGSVPKWAIFAPIFVPLFIRLGVEPQSVLAAYRIGDAPVNPITPLMVYLPFILTIAQRYDRKAGIGTLIALMLPYTVIIAVVWIILLSIWFGSTSRSGQTTSHRSRALYWRCCDSRLYAFAGGTAANKRVHAIPIYPCASTLYTPLRWHQSLSLRLLPYQG
ncbi:hypothetical protein HC891_04905 [Candidatus Gracilibacteria bacterium]|nr:hypothetical protein [Candidatus Gracilibacteria bacterium]